jgi:hypothetical protein
VPQDGQPQGVLCVFIVDPQEVPVKINSYSRYDDALVKTSKGLAPQDQDTLSGHDDQVPNAAVDTPPTRTEGQFDGARS